LLKATETAEAAGGTHFQIINAADASKASTIVDPGTSKRQSSDVKSLRPQAPAALKL
jgi:hypothetical protein